MNAGGAATRATPPSTGDELGLKILGELDSSMEYECVLGRSEKEICECRAEMQRGVVPRAFSFPPSTPLSPRTPQDFALLAEKLGLETAGPSLWERLTEKVLNYPTKCAPVKEVFAGMLRTVAKRDLEANKKLSRPLFASLISVLSRSTALFSKAILLPLIRPEAPEHRISGDEALVIARVIMKARTRREHMEAFIEELLELSPSAITSTILTAILIKQLKLSAGTADRVADYVAEGVRASGTYLTWNKMVLVFARNYPKVPGLSEVARLYASIPNPSKIEVEIVKTLSL